jgi:hypothetical protein
MGEDFERARPSIIGAILDVVSSALLNLPAVVVAELPRMADYAQWIEAASPALGWEPGVFVEIYKENLAAGATAILEGPLAQALMGLMLPYAGSATELLAAINATFDEKSPVLRAKSWPKDGTRLSGALRRLAPVLRGARINIEFDRNSTRGEKRLIRIPRAPEKNDSPAEEPRKSASSASSMSSDQENLRELKDFPSSVDDAGPADDAGNDAGQHPFDDADDIDDADLQTFTADDPVFFLKATRWRNSSSSPMEPL